MSPLDENHQALLIRLYRLAGDDDAARRQYDAWAAVAERDLGAPPVLPCCSRCGKDPGWQAVARASRSRR